MERGIARSDTERGTQKMSETRDIRRVFCRNGALHKQMTLLSGDVYRIITRGIGQRKVDDEEPTRQKKDDGIIIYA